MIRLLTMDIFQLKFIILLLCFLADYIHPCNSTSSECLTKATQDAIPEFVKGIPHLNIPSLDPFVIEKLAIPLQGLTVTFYKGVVTGFKSCIADNVTSFLDKREFTLQFHCNITIAGQYTAIGQLLLFPINGGGDAKVKLRNLRMKVHTNTKYNKDKKGLVYFGIRNYQYTFEYGDKMTFELENLFKESPELSKTVLQFLNENWKVVAEEFGKPIVDYSVELALKEISKFFDHVPIMEMLNVDLPNPLPGYE